MSKRIKYAKLRLAKSAGDAAAAAVEIAVESTHSGQTNEGENILRSCKKSKFFTNECSSQNTFMDIGDEQAEDTDGDTSICNSRRRPQELPETCSKDGPKLPKVRKKSSKGNLLISNFLNNHPTEDDDFEESKPSSSSQPRQTKVQRVLKPKPKVQRRPKNQSDIRKIFKKYNNDYDILHELIKDHSASEQVDSEQLQIALAMSRSLADQECSTSGCSSVRNVENTSNCSASSEERRIIGIRTTLEQFGFRCKNRYTDYDLNVIFGAGCKNVKKIKHKRATNLQRRTREELSEFIDSQTKKLFPLGMSNGTCAVFSLENVQSHLSQLFWIAQTEQASQHLLDKYYVPELLEVNPAPIDCLLKDWSRIPGRETTPERENCAISMGLEVSVCREAAEEKRARSTSPDLFDEYDDCVSNENRSRCTEIIEPLQLGHNASLESEQPAQKTEKAIETSCLLVEAKLRTTVAAIKYSEKNKDTNSSYCENKHTTEKVNYRQMKTNKENMEHGKVIVIENNSKDSMEEEHFSTAMNIPSHAVASLHRSSENIFDETDTDIIVSYEVYSSDEEKISVASQACRVISSAINNINAPDQTSIAATHTEPDTNACAIVHPSNDHIDQNFRNAESTQEVLSRDNGEPCTTHLFTDEKEYSFNRLAIKARLSDALEKSANMIETVDLVGDSEDMKEDNEDVVANKENLKVEYSVTCLCRALTETQDDVLYISDDEVNYSIRGERRPVESFHCTNEAEHPMEDDVDNTVSYYDGDRLIQAQVDTTNASLVSLSQKCTDHEILSISSNGNIKEPVAVERAANCAESTFVYLDSLVKQFNLPPIRSQKSVPNGSESKNLQEAQKSDFKCNKAVERKAVVGYVAGCTPEQSMQVDQTHNRIETNRASFISDPLANYLENYEAPDFDENEIEAEMVASQGPSKDADKELQSRPSAKVWGRIKSCTELVSPKKRQTLLKRMISETGTLTCSTPKEDQPVKVERFDGKFDELKLSYNALESPQFLISALNIGLRAPSYENMSTPEIERELFKNGLKVFKRSKAIKVLHYLFEQTHPFVEVEERVEHIMGNEVIQCSDENHLGAEINDSPSTCVATIPQKFIGNALRPRVCPFKLDPDVGEIFLPSVPRKRNAWCLVPLHIAFFNLVSESEALQQQILRYEPINLDEIYNVLKGVGLRYATNDMIAFLDRQCITFRSASSSGDRTKAKEKDGNE